MRRVCLKQMYFVAKYMQKTTFLIPNLLSFQHEMAKQVSETYYNGLRIQFGGKQVRYNRIRGTKHKDCICCSLLWIWTFLPDKCNVNWCHGDTFKLLPSQENDWLTRRDFVLFSGAFHCLRVKVTYNLKIKYNCCNELFAGFSDIMILIYSVPCCCWILVLL